MMAICTFFGGLRRTLSARAREQLRTWRLCHFEAQFMLYRMRYSLTILVTLCSFRRFSTWQQRFLTKTWVLAMRITSRWIGILTRVIHQNNGHKISYKSMYNLTIKASAGSTIKIVYFVKFVIIYDYWNTHHLCSWLWQVWSAFMVKLYMLL